METLKCLHLAKGLLDWFYVHKQQKLYRTGECRRRIITSFRKDLIQLFKIGLKELKFQQPFHSENDTCCGSMQD
jgi:hypothetical protein